MKILVLITLVFGIVSSERSNSCEGTVIGVSWHMDGYLKSRDGIDLAECQEFCNTTQDCKGYSWVQEEVVSWCYLFKELKDPQPCAGCHSQVRPETN